MSTQEQTNAGNSYVRNIWIKGGIYALIVVLLLLIKATFNVLLLILAGVLIAVYFRGLSGLICRKTHWKSGVCVATAIAGTLLLMAGFLVLAGARVAQQATELHDQLPRMTEQAKARISQYPIGQRLVARASSPKAAKKLQQQAGTFFRSTFGVLGDVYVVLILGIFFTVSPGRYRQGMIRLIPEKGQQKGAEVLDRLGGDLKKWLKGKLFAMFVVFVLTAIGLVIVGVPMWLVLALIAGLLNFIPNFGPLIAMIPAVLVALMQGPATAGMVAGMYMLIQVVESNLITPTVQRKLVSIPPALIIMAQLLMGPLSGGWGLLLATPLMLIVIMLVQELYIKKQRLTDT